MSRKLDAWVAEHVFERQVYFSDKEFVNGFGDPISDYRCNMEKGISNYRHWVPKYSTDISEAWDIVEEMTADDNIDIFLKDKKWYVDLDWVGHNPRHVPADALPLAICLASYLAKTGKDWNEEED